MMSGQHFSSSTIVLFFRFISRHRSLRLLLFFYYSKQGKMNEAGFQPMRLVREQPDAQKRADVLVII